MTFQEFQNWVYKVNDIYPSYIQVSNAGLGMLQLSICFQKDGKVGRVTRCISLLPGLEKFILEELVDMFKQQVEAKDDSA